MLRIALADDASHAVAFHNFAMLTDRLNACANFHRTLRTIQEPKKLRPDLNSNQHPKFKQGDGLRKLQPSLAQPKPIAPDSRSNELGEN